MDNPRGEQIRRARRLVDEHGLEMRDRYEAGEYLRDLAQEFGITEQTVAGAVRRFGGEVRKRGFGSNPARFRGKGNPAYLRGYYLKDGYRCVLVPDDFPFSEMAGAKGYALEHRLVMATMIKRPLLPSETVHHINGDRQDNRPDNLQLRAGRHGVGTHWRCSDCGSQNVSAVAL